MRSLNDNVLNEQLNFRIVLGNIAVSTINKEHLLKTLPYYDMIRMKEPFENENYQLTETSEFNDILNLKNITKDLDNSLINKDKCVSQKNLSFYGYEYESLIHKNMHKRCIILNLNNDLDFFVINPKHKNEIERDDNIKKWSTTMILKKGDFIIIPSEWFYLYKTSKDSVFAKIVIDTISSFIFNTYFKNIF